MTNVVIKVKGMSCRHCVKAVEDALMELEGIKKANVSLEKSEAEIEYDESKVSTDKMLKTIQGIEYEALL